MAPFTTSTRQGSISLSLYCYMYRKMLHLMPKFKELYIIILTKFTLLITPYLHGPYQGSLTNNVSPNHLTFLTLGILTRSQGGVTQVSV